MRWVRRFLEWLEEENLELDSCTYSDLMSMIEKYRRESRSIIYINQGLWGVQRFYNFLIAESITEYNPAANFRVKGGVTKAVTSGSLPGDALPGIPTGDPSAAAREKGP